MKKLLLSLVLLTAGCTVDAMSAQEIKSLQAESGGYSRGAATRVGKNSNRVVEYNERSANNMNRETAMVRASKERNEMRGMSLNNGRSYNDANEIPGRAPERPTDTTAKPTKRKINSSAHTFTRRGGGW